VQGYDRRDGIREEGGRRSVTGERAPARNEALFREVNERILELSEGHGVDAGELVPFLCECAALGCGGTVSLTLGEYESVRTRDRVFVLLRGHEQPELERVVGELRDYLLVEKEGAADEVAEGGAR
jgi:hypothetical protein